MTIFDPVFIEFIITLLIISQLHQNRAKMATIQPRKLPTKKEKKRKKKTNYLGCVVSFGFGSGPSGFG